MRYVLCIDSEEEIWMNHDEATQADVMKRHGELERDLRVEVASLFD